MSKTTRCDVCGRTAPDVNCRYSRKKKLKWFRFDCDSQGGSYRELDVCDSCYNGWEYYMKEKHQKEADSSGLRKAQISVIYASQNK